MKTIIAASLAALVTTGAGCQQSAPTTAPNNDKETNIKIRTPGANVDVQGKGDGKGDGKGVDVDVERKKNRP